LLKILRLKSEKSTEVVHYCPACGDTHIVTTDRAPGASGPSWTVTGSDERPTFLPSVRVSWHRTGDPPNVCHYFVRDGFFEYCQDSSHQMAGQRVPVPDIPKVELEFWQGVERHRSEELNQTRDDLKNSIKRSGSK
jgi:hypothetical protein